MYNITEKSQLEKYKQIFEKIETIVESPELKRYIPLMQTPLPFPKNESKTNERIHEGIRCYHRRKENR